MQIQNLATSTNHDHGNAKRVPSKSYLMRRCNLCDQTFIALSRFQRFCGECKEKNDLYHYYETLPSVSEQLR